MLNTKDYQKKTENLIHRSHRTRFICCSLISVYRQIDIYADVCTTNVTLTRFHTDLIYNHIFEDVQKS